MISAQDVSPGGGGGGGGETRGGGGGGESPSDRGQQTSCHAAAGAARRRTSTSTSTDYNKRRQHALGKAPLGYIVFSAAKNTTRPVRRTARAGTATRRCGKRLLARAHLDTRAVHRLGVAQFDTCQNPSSHSLQSRMACGRGRQLLRLFLLGRLGNYARVGWKLTPSPVLLALGAPNLQTSHTKVLL